MQGKRHIKIELCVKSSLLRLFHVNHVVQNRQSALSPACHKCGFHVKAKNERFTAASFRCRQKLKVKTSRCRLADYVKTSHQKACRTCSTIIFLHSTNRIIDLWRCRWRCCRQILNFGVQLDIWISCVLFAIGEPTTMNLPKTCVISCFPWEQTSCFLLFFRGNRA